MPKAAVAVESDTAGTPVPDSVVNCGLLLAVSITVIWPPVVGPRVLGVNLIPMMQVELPGKEPPLVGQVVTALVSRENGPPKTTDVRERAVAVVLFKVTVWVALGVERTCAPKAMLAGPRKMVDPPGTRPVPVSAMLCGELPALSTMVTVAERPPVVAGVKWPWMVQLAPAARLVPQLLAITKEEASTPDTEMLVMDRAAPPVFVSVIDCDPEDDPTVTFPKAMALAESEAMGGLNAEPDSATVWVVLLALSVMVIAAVKVPVAVGANSP